MRVLVKNIIAEKAFGIIFGSCVEDPGDARNGCDTRVKATFSIMTGRPVVGETWEIEGDIQETQWGSQIEATRAIRALPSGRLMQHYLAAHVPGVGPSRAKALWDKYGNELGNVLDDDLRLPEIAEILGPGRPLLSVRLAADCAAAWRSVRTETLTMEWLSNRGIEDTKVARTVLKLFGEEAVEQLTANPYCLVPLLPWANVDKVGLQLLAEDGIAKPRQDRRRLVGAVDMAIKRLLKEGATAISHGDLRKTLTNLLNAAGAVDAAIEAGTANQAIVQGPLRMWRAPGAAVMEAYLFDTFHRMVATANLDECLSDCFKAAVNAFRADGRALHSEQREAVLQTLERPLAILAGGAGTGKTTVTRAIADIWADVAKGDVVLCAIAGKAALRLSQATGRLAFTIARLLNELRQRDELESRIAEGRTTKQDANSALQRLAKITPHSMVIVDESSMVDLSSLYNLVRHMPEGARLLLVGDEGQLPPVSFGLVFHKMVVDDRIVARLAKVHRQTEAGGIPAVSRMIRERRMPALGEYAGPADGVSIKHCANENVAEEVENVWADLGGLDGEALIVTPSWKGAAGVENLNERLQRRNAQYQPVLKGHFGQWFSVADPVMWLRNDYRRGLFNRMLGRVLSINAEARSVLVDFDGVADPVQLVRDDLADLALAYAMTVHSSQGSQAPVVIMPLFSNKLLDPSLIYTAITRAQRQVIFVGNEEVIVEALHKRWAAETRSVGFEWPQSKGF